MLELVVRLVASLAVVVGLLMLLARFGGRKFRGAQDSPVHVVHRQPLSRTSSVAVVEVGGRVLVLGTTEQQVSILTELPAGAMEAGASTVVVPEPAAPADQPEPGILDTDRIAVLAALLERSLSPADEHPTEELLPDGPRTHSPAPAGIADAAVGASAGRHRADAPGRRAAVRPADQPEQAPSVAYAGRRAARPPVPAAATPAAPVTAAPITPVPMAVAPTSIAPAPAPTPVGDALSVLPPALAALARAEAEELGGPAADEDGGDHLSPIDQLLAMLPEHPPAPERPADPVVAASKTRTRRAASDGSGPLAGSVLSPQTWRQALTAVRRAS